MVVAAAEAGATKPLDQLLETHVYVGGQLMEEAEVNALVEKGLLSTVQISKEPLRSGWGDTRVTG